MREEKTSDEWRPLLAPTKLRLLMIAVPPDGDLTAFSVLWFPGARPLRTLDLFLLPDYF